MFTGLITHVGKVAKVEDGAGGRAFRVEGGMDSVSVPTGASIAHAGVCLTVTEQDEAGWTVYASPETLARTTLGAWEVGTRVNLEASLKLGDELGGHLVFGHADAIGRIETIEDRGQSREITFALPAEIAPLVARKGSIAVDGVSLTVNAVTNETFKVAIIPHTWDATTLADRRPGDHVNLEADMLARYVARRLNYGGGT